MKRGKLVPKCVDINSINEDSSVDFKESPVLWRGVGVLHSLMPKGSFESGKFTLKITCESGKLFTTGCCLPPKSRNSGTLGARPLGSAVTSACLLVSILVR